MKKTFAILFASTALTAGVGLPAWSAMHGAARFEGPRDAALAAIRDAEASPMLVSEDDDDHDRDRDHRRKKRRGHDDHHDEDGDDDSYGGNVSPAAPAGSVAPPNNGLFGSGTTPKVQMN